MIGEKQCVRKQYRKYAEEAEENNQTNFLESKMKNNTYSNENMKIRQTPLVMIKKQ